MTILKTFKYKRRFICYVAKTYDDFYIVNTGVPPKNPRFYNGCISWRYSTEEEAQRQATSYYNNYMKFEFIN